LKTSQHETNLKQENVTVSTHIIYNYIFVVTAAKHLPASTIWCPQKLRVARMVGYYCMFLSCNISKFTQFWMRFYQLTQIWFGLLQFTQMLIIYANLNQPLHPYRDLSNSAQVGMKLFQIPKFDWGCWNYSNVSNCVQISMKHLHITHTGMKLFHLVQF